MKPKRPGLVPLERALSKLGIASRMQARAMILDGKVAVNGSVKNNPGFMVIPEKTRITIDGESVTVQAKRTFLLYKPKGLVTTRADEKGRHTVFSLIKEPGLNLHAVGRLDMATTGLLLLTNNPRLSAWLTDPANEVRRTYLVSARGLFTESEKERLLAGISEGTDKLHASKITIRKTSHRESHLVVELTEGKNREIRRMFLALGHEVTALKRVAFGSLVLGDLKPGEYRELTTEELAKAFPNADSSQSRKYQARSR